MHVIDWQKFVGVGFVGEIDRQKPTNGQKLIIDY